MHARRGRTLPLRHLLVLLTGIGLLPLALLAGLSIQFFMFVTLIFHRDLRAATSLLPIPMLSVLKEWLV